MGWSTVLHVRNLLSCWRARCNADAQTVDCGQSRTRHGSGLERLARACKYGFHSFHVCFAFQRSMQNADARGFLDQFWILLLIRSCAITDDRRGKSPTPPAGLMPRAFTIMQPRDDDRVRHGSD